MSPVDRTARFLAASEMAESLSDAARAAGAALQAYPRGPMGLVLDEAKRSAEYRRDDAAFQRAFAASREFNAWYTREFKVERAAARAARCPA